MSSFAERLGVRAALRRFRPHAPPTHHASRITRRAGAERRRTHHVHRAFTLIEIMVAVMIFSMVIAAIYATWALIMRATQVGQNAAAQAQRQRVVLRTIGDAVRGIASFQASQVSPQDLYGFVFQNGQDPTLSFVSHLPDTFPRNGKFVGEATMRDANGNVRGLDASLRRVTFSLAAGADGEKDLVLRQKLTLMDMDQDEQQYPLVLARNVKEFKLEWWGTNDLGKVDWFAERDESLSNTIPQMLRVHLVLGANADKGNNAADFSATRIYTVPSQMMPAFAQHGIGPGPGQGGLGVPGRPTFNPQPGGTAPRR